jgi:small subunit ribosomal protein S3
LRGFIVGQKTHPKGFRLVTTQKHLSNWYCKKISYPNRIHEDFLIRDKIESTYKSILTTSKIEINRVEGFSQGKELVNIKLYALYPRVKETQKKIIKQFEQFLPVHNEKITGITVVLEENLKDFTSLYLKQKAKDVLRYFQLKTHKIYSLKFEFIKNPFEDATLIAKYIAEQLEKRIPFRRAIKQAIKKIQYTSKQGLKIQVSGRLNGIDIARSEWKREGKVPLHTLKANIDYTHQQAQTIYGVIGIKVWLFAQEN